MGKNIGISASMSLIDMKDGEITWRTFDKLQLSE
jgi:hypothetical protein